MRNKIGKFDRSYWELPIFIAIRRTQGFSFIFDLFPLRIDLAFQFANFVSHRLKNDGEFLKCLFISWGSREPEAFKFLALACLSYQTGDLSISYYIIFEHLSRLPKLWNFHLVDSKYFQIKFITNKFLFTGRCHFQLSNIRITKRFWLSSNWIRVLVAVTNEILKHESSKCILDLPRVERRGTLIVHTTLG
jgi:hypothetical protein